MSTTHHDHSAPAHAHPHPAAAPDPAGLKDPVCGMAVTEQSEHHVSHEGRPVYFCSAKCQTKFAADPARYAGAAGATSGRSGTHVKIVKLSGTFMST